MKINDPYNKNRRKIAFMSFLKHFFPMLVLLLLPAAVSLCFPKYESRQEKIEVISGGLWLNQVVLVSLYVIAIGVVYHHRKEALEIVKNNKLALILIAYFLLACTWSSLPQLSYKRWVHIPGTFLIAVCAVLGFQGDKRIAIIIVYTSAFLIIASFLSIFLLPSLSRNPEGHFTGIFHHKNTLGQVAGLSIVIWLSILRRNLGVLKWGGILAIVGISFWLLLGSNSRTPLVAMVAGVTCLAVLKTPLPKSISLLFLTSLIFMGTLFCFNFLHTSPMAVALELGGRDATGTGRTEIWKFVWEQVKARPIQGYGYNAFWAGNKGPAYYLHQKFLTWYPNSAHSGYLDVLVETGIIGFTLFMLLYVQFFFRLRSYFRQNKEIGGLFIAFVVAFTLYNVAESGFFSTGGNFAWTIFFLIYISTTPMVQREFSSPIAGKVSPS